MRKIKRAKRKNEAMYWSQFCRRNKGNLIIGAILSVATSGVSIALAFLLQKLIDVASYGTLNDLVDVFVFGGILLAAFLTIEFLKRFFVHRFYYKGLVNYKEHVFKHIISNSVRAFFQNKTGTYLSGLNNDINAIETGYLENIFAVITLITLFIGGLAAMAWFNLVLFGCVIASSLLPILVSLLLSGKVEKWEKRVSDKNDSYVSTLRDILSGFTVIKSFQVEDEIERIFHEKNRELEETKRKRRNAISDVLIFSELASELLLIIVFGVGAYLTISGKMTAGAIVGCIQLLNYVSAPIQQLPNVFSRIHAARTLVDKMQEEVECGQDETETIQIDSFQKSICFDKLSFSYEPEKPVLQEISLKFEKGKSYAIVGASGSGKSTILNMLLGHYRNYSGSLTLDGVEIRDISSNSLYQMISIIQQGVFIFDDSISANITMYKEFPEEKLNDAIRRSGLQKLIEEKGGDYQCGEGGSNLSGGERQRISIARALLKGTQILLLDEATAALDNITAAMVEDAILELNDLTRIVVTHKLNRQSMRKYDCIIVISDGRVVEQGTLKELEAKNEYLSAFFSIAGSDE